MKTARTTVHTTLALAALLAAAGTAAGGTYTFSDNNLADADWSLTTVMTGSGGSVTVSDSTSGNPGNSRQVFILNNGGASLVRGLHLGLASAATFDSGAESIASIEFRLDGFASAGTNNAGHRIGMAIRQGGVDYISGGVQGSFKNTGWRNNSLTLTAANFARTDGLAGTPDFSDAGAPITLGFHTSNGNGAEFGAISQTCRYDNFSVTINTIPAPGAMGLASLGALLAGRRRRAN